MNKVIVLLGCMSIMCSCSLFQNTDPQDERYLPVWDYDFEVGYFSSIDPIIFESKVVYSGLDQKKSDFSANSTLEAFDKRTGKQLWVWKNGIEESYGQFNYLGLNYVHEGVLHISTGVDYSIDLKTGGTIDFYNEPRYGGQSFSGVNDYIIADYSTKNGDQRVIKITKTKFFDWKKIFEFRNTDTATYGVSEFVFTDKSAIVPFFKWNKISNVSKLGLMTFDLQSMKLTSSTFLSDRSFERFLDYPPLLIANHLFMSMGGEIAAINLNKQAISWTRKTMGHSSRSGIMYSDGVLYVNTEFQLYALDAESGRIIWQIDSSAGSRMIEDDGVVYYTDGIHLRGVDALTGEVLLEVDAPSYATDGGAFFQPVLTIDHENDRIYTASYTHAYCYPTLR